MTLYPQYKKYKSTRCAWLAEIPEHWEIKRIKSVATYNDETLDERTDPDFEIDYVDISSVTMTNGIEKIETIQFEKAPSRARRKVKNGDIIVSTVRTYLKAIAPICDPPENMIVSTGFAVIRPQKNFHSGFAGYLLQSHGFVGEVASNSVGVSYPAINASDLVRIPAVEPPLQEQQTIARFLDFKTAQIDALISRQKILLDKLAEKRTALISHAVTKGLDQSVPMKDSKEAWLGQVPEHWKMTRIRFVIEALEQGWSPQCNNYPADGEQWGVMKVGCVNGDRFDASENKALPEDLDPLIKYELRNGDILVSRANTKELLGSAALVANVRPRLLLCDKLYRMKAAALVDADYLVRFLRSSIARYHYERHATGTSGSMQNIGQDTLKNVPFPLPPKAEQKRISEYLNDVDSDISLQIKKAGKVIEKLKEYRSALVTNAVTGKIDVRGFTVPQAVDGVA
ncbi:restriction endonuclease subunit S [Burkholderia sp. BKH01]|uniref:restriction endonuclease subunit S n=1 Tax=Burkholderia sp. BKH01 TaxID=2769262 RepID=UPI0021E03A3E|nr:restriction endonuclease subunit S [Burkholderia sp. BKH01]MCU9958493.1 restriction endonuclease subunit S [Burkholderia sp. BKH01]